MARWHVSGLVFVLALALAAVAAGRTQSQAVAAKLVRVTGGLDAPLYVTQPDGDERLFVVEQTGKIRVVKDGKLLGKPFADLKRSLKSGGEQGLLSVAFHPKFSENGKLYVDFTDKQGDTRIWELHAAPGASHVDRGHRELLKIDQPYDNHNGGQMQFDRRGRLVIGMGDGGSAGDPEGRAQDGQSLLGKLLRIDVDGREPYAIPADNPFRDTAAVRPEIYALGLRNPWRFSFDRANHDLWIGDVGQNEIEEIDHVRTASRGGWNFGWNHFEGRAKFDGGRSLAGGALRSPVYQYRHADGLCSVTGGYVYRGPRIAGLNGRYVFADYCGDRLYALRRNGGRPADLRAITKAAGVEAITSFGEAADGTLYVCANDSLYRFASRS